MILDTEHRRQPELPQPPVGDEANVVLDVVGRHALDRAMFEREIDEIVLEHHGAETDVANIVLDCFGIAVALLHKGMEQPHDPFAMQAFVANRPADDLPHALHFIEALEEAAISLGFTPAQAREFALETFRGGALLAAQSNDSLATLRAQVTSKRGTTEAAILQLDAREVKAHIIAAVQAAQARSKELGAT